LLELDVFSFEDGDQPGQLPYPVPMAGPDFFEEVITALLQKLANRTPSGT
jgi:hypothetical protein